MTTALEEERDFLLRSIADLDAEYEAGDLDEGDYRALRDEYTARAAAVLRALDGPRPAADASVSASGSVAAHGVASGRRTGVRRTAWVALVVTVAIGAGWLVARSAGERVDGEAASGSIPEASTDRIARAQRLVRQNDIRGAVEVYDQLLKDDPRNPVALAELGWLVSRVDDSLVDSGLRRIDRAIELDPGYAEAYFYRGMILLQAKDDPEGAREAFDTALRSDPPPDLRRFLEQMRDQAEANQGADDANQAEAPAS